MASDLDSIYAALAAVSVSLGGVTPVGVTPDMVRRRVAPSELPRRMLSPVGGNTAPSMVRQDTLDGGMVATWSIHDMLIYKVASVSLEEVAGDLTEYCQNYANALAAIRWTLRDATNETTIERLTLVTDQFQWGGLTFWGVEAQLTIKEMTT